MIEFVLALTLIIITITSFFIVFIMHLRTKNAVEAAEKALAGGRDFFRIAGDADRMLHRATLAWTLDPDLDNLILMLDQDDRRGIRSAEAEAQKIQEWHKRLEELETKYSKWIGQ